jgi:hypothetical protein
MTTSPPLAKQRPGNNSSNQSLITDPRNLYPHRALLLYGLDSLRTNPRDEPKGHA